MVKNLSGRDALIIVPPIAPDAPILGPHVLQASAAQAGFSVGVYYGALDFMNLIGPALYRKIGGANFTFAGDHVFKAAVYGGPGIGAVYEGLQDEAALLGADWPHFMPQFKLFNGDFPIFDKKSLLELEIQAQLWIKKTAEYVISLEIPVIGCSISYEQTNAALAVLKAVKKLNPRIVTLVGGANCRGKMALGVRSLDPEKKIVDFIFSGDGEEVFPAFLDDIKQGKKPDPAEGIIYSGQCRDLDTIPLPDFSDYFDQLPVLVPDYKEYYEEITIPYETSRGCWWQLAGQNRPLSGCLFCCAGETVGYRKKSAEKVISEIEDLTARFAPDRIKMTDMVMPLEYFTTLLPDLSKKSGNSPSFFYEIRTNPLTFEDLVFVKKSGIKRMLMGIESLSAPLLELMNKGASVAQNIRALRYAKSLSLPVEWNILWGFPGEKSVYYQKMNEFLLLIRHLQPPTGLFHLGLNRFSHYTDNPAFSPVNELEPVGSYYTAFPEYADFGNLARYFKPNFQAETQDNPDAILELADKIEEWHGFWKKGGPMCRIFPGGDGGALLMDTRGIVGTQSLVKLSAKQVDGLLTWGRYSESEFQDWALAGKLALVEDGEFIPLTTGPEDLMRKYDKER